MRAIALNHRWNPITAVFIQEHNLNPQEEKTHIQIAKDAGLMWVASYGRAAANGVHYGGTGVVMPFDAIETRGKETRDEAIEKIYYSRTTMPNGRLTAIDTRVEGQRRRLASAYAPANPKPDAHVIDVTRVRYMQLLDRHITKRTVLGIDANCVPDPGLDVKSDATTPYENAGSVEFEQIIDHKSLIDVARAYLGDVPFYTAHHLVSTGEVHSRIDRIYVPDDPHCTWTHQECSQFFPVQDGRVERDHDAISVVVTRDEQERGADVEYINERAYTQASFNARTFGMIRRYARAPRDVIDARIAWEQMKEEHRKMAMAETKKLQYVASKTLRLKRAQLLAQQKRATQGLTTDLTAEDELRKEIRELSRNERTLHETLEEEAYSAGKSHDTCSAEFFRSWNPSRRSQTPAAMKEGDFTDPSRPIFSGAAATTVQGVIDVFTNFYSSLYARKTTKADAQDAAFAALRSGRRVLPPTAAKCSAAVSAEEILATMRTRPTGKSPGPDRIPNIFYRTFAAELGPFLEEVLAESRAKGALPPTFLQGITSVLYKKKDPDDPRNYRPITLLNTDYKIFTRILADRMNEAVKQFVSPDQNGFTPEGFIGENTMRLHLLKAHAECQKMDAFFLFLDMEKAFDRCDWEYMLRAMKELGFDDSFIDCIALFYSHDQPPTRQVHLNGHLGSSFPLASGVAQGCPLSPLLFLLITEAFTRRVNADTLIAGIRVGNIAHKISQYADDSVLIGVPASVAHPRGDMPRFQFHITEWEYATGMIENLTKREGLLIGTLARNPQRAPPNVVPQWAQYGVPIITLGVPIGNGVDIQKWTFTKYRQVKGRIAAFRGTGHLSLTGRRLLIQAILYGSVRYWFFSIIFSDSVIEAIESDAQQLLWAAHPELYTDEEGSSAGKRAYIKKGSAFLPEKDGGAGIMHLESHAKAFRASWIRRYIEPGSPPWKQIADQWLASDYLGRGTLFANCNRHEVLERVPYGAQYLRRCISDFLDIDLRQVCTDEIPPTVKGEPLLHGWRIDLSGIRWAQKWIKNIALARVRDAIDENTGDVFSHAAMTQRTQDLAPASIRMTPTVFEFSDKLMHEWSSIANAITPQIVAASGAEVKTQFKYAKPESGGEGVYLRIEGNVSHVQWLDIRNGPHDTGETMSVFALRNHSIVDVAIWLKILDEDHEVRDAGDDAEKEPRTSLHLIGPADRAFPAMDTWKPHDAPTKPPGLLIGTPAHLSIRRLTHLFQYRHAHGERPSCEELWQGQFPGPPIPWAEIWPSLGTPLSDATEEKHWRKLLHRAIFTHTRDPKVSSKCRLGCGADEHQRHLCECRVSRRYWDAVFSFIRTVLGAPTPQRRTEAIVLNRWSANTIGPVEACAFIRHAFGVLYCALSAVDLKNRRFVWEFAFERLMLAFQNAVLRYGQRILRFHNSRHYSGAQDTVPLEVCTQFKSLLSIDGSNGGSTHQFALTPAFKQAIAAAQSAVTMRRTNTQAGRGH